ncbi:MAG: motility-associated protein, partial [Geminicoccales bacterium]
MFLIIGSAIVLGCVVGSYMALGGKLHVLWQPFELVIIAGSGIGAYIIANPKNVLGRTMGGFASVMRGAKYKKADYV